MRRIAKEKKQIRMMIILRRSFSFSPGSAVVGLITGRSENAVVLDAEYVKAIVQIGVKLNKVTPSD